MTGSFHCEPSQSVSLPTADKSVVGRKRAVPVNAPSVHGLGIRMLTPVSRLRPSLLKGARDVSHAPVSWTTSPGNVVPHHAEIPPIKGPNRRIAAAWPNSNT